MKFIKIWIASVIALVLAFGGVAFAADAVDPASSTTMDILKSVYNAFAGGHYAYCGALGLMLGVALIKRYFGTHPASWFHSDVGGTSMTLLGAFGASLTASLAGGGPLTLGLMKTALLVGVGAAGGYSILKKLVVEPILRPLAAKAPASMQFLFQAIFWIFDKPDPIAAAESAGQAAVEAAPAQGAESIVGKPTEIK